MCYTPVKVVPKRYYTNIEYKGRFLESALYDGQIYNVSQRYCYYPCGKCYECREARIEAWQIRWHEHIKDSVEGSNYLLTLTYNDLNLPFIKNHNTNEEISSLNYKDVQKFIKRLRKRQDTYCKKNELINPKISYHGCGEYGTKFTKRPHYHILISNLIIPPDEIERIWSHGIVHVGDDVNSNTIKYVLKYTLKSSLQSEKKIKIVDNSGDFMFNIYENGNNKGRVCEKTFCSKGIGKSFINDDVIKYYHNNVEANYFYYNSNKLGKIESKVKPLPRYYKELIYNPNVIENGRIKRDSQGRPIKLYSPLSDDFESTPRFKKLMYAYKKEREIVNQTVDLIHKYGPNYVLENARQTKILKIQQYIKNLKKRQILQEHRNEYQGALLI